MNGVLFKTVLSASQIRKAANRMKKNNYFSFLTFEIWCVSHCKQWGRCYSLRILQDLNAESQPDIKLCFSLGMGSHNNSITNLNFSLPLYHKYRTTGIHINTLAHTEGPQVKRMQLVKKVVTGRLIPQWKWAIFSQHRYQ